MQSYLFGLFFFILGLWASLANVFVIIVFVSNRTLRSRSQLFVALAVGDLIFGLGFVLNAVHDYYEQQLHWICLQIGPWLCMTMTLALTLERACAVFLPYWYKTCFKPRHRFIAIALGSFVTLLHSAITFLMALRSKDVNLDTCVRVQSSRRNISMISISLIALNYVFCFCLNVFSYCRARSKSHAIRESRELQRIKLITWISFLSMISLVVPFSFLLVHVSLLSNRNTMLLQNSFVTLIFSLIPIDSSSNLFLYLWLKRLFRQQAKHVLSIFCRDVDEENTPRLRMNVSDCLLTNTKA